MQVRSNVVTVLTAKAIPATEVTAAMAEQARAEAEALPFGNAVERANKAKARDRAQGMLKVVGRNASTAGPRRQRRHPRQPPDLTPITSCPTSPYASKGTSSPLACAAGLSIIAPNSLRSASPPSPGLCAV